MVIPTAQAPIPLVEEKVSDAIGQLEAAYKFLLPGNPARDAAAIAQAQDRIIPGLFPNDDAPLDPFADMASQRPFITCWATDHSAQSSSGQNTRFGYSISIHLQWGLGEVILADPAVDPLKQREVLRSFANHSGLVFWELKEKGPELDPGIDTTLGYRGGIPFYNNRATAEAGPYLYATTIFRLGGVRG